MKNTGYIYKIVNTVDGKIYIGKTTTSLYKRMKGHLAVAKRPRTYTSYLYNAINYYGQEAFRIELVEECSLDQIDERERYWIQKLHSQDHTIGYNIQEGGKGGAVRSEEYVPSVNQLKSLEAGRKRPASPLLKKILSERRRGCQVSQDTREKLRQGSLGRVRIHKGTINKRPKQEEIERFLKDGWELGYCSKKRDN